MSDTATLSSALAQPEDLTQPVDIRRQDGILTITINDPATRNAMGTALFTDGKAALEAAASDDSIGAVILTGAGDTFCSGGDLRMLGGLKTQPDSVLEQAFDGFHGFITALRAVPVPVIAAVEGNAAGAGFSMAVACDLLIAAEDAKFSMAYIKVGLNPDGGASAFLSRGLPHQLVAEILFSGEAIEASRLHQLGVVNRLVPAGAALPTARALAARLTQGPRQALGRCKTLVEQARQNTLSQQLDLEAHLFGAAIRDAESTEGMRAFMEKRAPRFR